MLAGGRAQLSFQIVVFIHVANVSEETGSKHFRDGGEQVRVVRGRGGHLGVTCELMALAKFLLCCPGHGDVVARPQDEQCQQTSLKPSLR